MRYLFGTPDYGICFGGGGGMEQLTGYCDADFAGDIDTRRSTTAYVFTYNGAAISWSSRLPQTVAASTTEAEYMAASAATKEALWLRKLLGDLKMLPSGPINIYSDSQSALKLLKNPIISMCSKHIEVVYHFTRDRVQNGDVMFTYLPTNKMIADALTKYVPEKKHILCREGMAIY